MTASPDLVKRLRLAEAYLKQSTFLWQCYLEQLFTLTAAPARRASPSASPAGAAKGARR